MVRIADRWIGGLISRKMLGSRWRPIGTARPMLPSNETQRSERRRMGIALATAALLAAGIVLAQDSAPPASVGGWERLRLEGRRAFEHGRYREAEPLLSRALIAAQELP